jgi:hypothetical protein
MLPENKTAPEANRRGREMVVQITAVLPTTAADSSPRLNSQLPLQATTAFAIAPCASPRRCCSSSTARARTGVSLHTKP